MATRRAAWHRQQQGAALLIFLILLVTAALTYVVNSLSPPAVDVRRTQQTHAALVQAREALLGYAQKYRDEQVAQGQPDRVYGYLPLPDLGSARNNNSGCTLEGCDAANFAGNALNTSVIGRLPWRTLGLPPLRDGAGECLWYIVSGSHQRQQRVTPMNWDTLGQLDIVVANGGPALASALASAHERPIAVIFSPGPPLPGQDRAVSASDVSDVSQCRGNYNVANYLDPASPAALGGISNSLAGSTNSASGITGDANPANDPDAAKSLSLQGKVFSAAGNLSANTCPGSECTLVANDIGLSVNSDTLFDALRKSGNFRLDINSMLDRMTECLRDKIATGTLIPKPIPGFATPADKSAGRIPDDSCYDDSKAPLGYYSHYSDLFFVARPSSGNFTVTVDGSAQSCPGVLIFAGQRSNTQLRTSASQRNVLENYLESPNLENFTTPGTSFAGPSQLARVTASQTRHQDIVRCIPSGTAFTTVDSPVLTTLGVGQLATYDSPTRTLTLGRRDVVSGNPTIGNSNANALFGCAWLADSQPIGSGLRSYFTFRFKDLDGSVGFNGFVFALADAEKSSLSSCGAAGSHLGYSGNNGYTPIINWPKIGVEFDQSRNTGFHGLGQETSGSSGRNDPPGTEYSSHAAIVYWGHVTANASDRVNFPDYDDNVHGYPATAPVTRPPPTNPPYPSPGVVFKNLRGQASQGGDSYLYHVRLEVTPTRNVAAPAEDSSTDVLTQVWLLADSPTVANQVAAMRNITRPMSQLYPSFNPDLLDVATLYDVAMGSCVSGTCPTGQTCGTGNICYRQALRTLRPGFTGAQRTTDQEVQIADFNTAWLP